MRILWHRRGAALLAAALAAALPRSEASAQSFLDVGKQPPITILIKSSPWYGGFEKVVQLYEQQTGNRVKLDVTPFGGMLEKARNAVRGQESPYDILNLDTQWTIEFYEGVFLSPLTEIVSSLQLHIVIVNVDDIGYSNT